MRKLSLPAETRYRPSALVSPVVRFLASLFLATTASAEVVLVDPDNAEPPGMISARLLPEKPASRVLDARSQLSVQAQAELSVALEKAAAKRIEIHTVFLGADPEIEPRRLGNELVRRWTPPEAEIGVLVLSLPGMTEPSVFIRTRLFTEADTAHFTGLARNALEQSFNEPLAYGASLELAASLPAALATIHRLRDEGKDKISTVEARASAPARERAPEARPEIVISHWDMFVATIDPRMKTLLRDCVICFGGLVLLAATLILMRLRRPRFFPQSEFRRRFSAPYSGGNNARVPTTRPEPLVHVPHG